MTTVIALAALIVYSLIGSYWWRRWAWEAKQDWINSRSDAIFLGMLQALVWPVVLAFKVLASSDTFMLPPPAIRQREREAQLQARIAELERKAGIR